MTIARHHRTVLISLATLLFAGGCGGGAGGGMGGKPTVTKTPTLSGPFTEISMLIPGELHVHKGAPSIKVEIDEDVAPNLTTNIVGKELTIATSQPVTNLGKCVIDLNCPAIERIGVTGASVVRVDDISAPNFDINVDGAADVQGTGSTQIESVKISGAGKVDLKGVACKTGSVTINGAGDCSVNASDTLSVSINGTGAVHYKGSPKLNKQINGTGSIAPL